MQLPPLFHGVLIKRYKRFLADIQLDDGRLITAHCANSGTLYGLTNPGRGVYVCEKPHTKLGWSWILADDIHGLVGVHTGFPNTLVFEAIMNGTIKELQGYTNHTAEQKYGVNSRIDWLLTAPDLPDCYVEVKNVHMCRTPALAEFPDAVTARGTKHLEELAHVVSLGKRAVLIYVVQRSDCTHVACAADIDPLYAKTLKDVRSKGVEVYAYACAITLQSITLHHALNVEDAP